MLSPSTPIPASLPIDPRQVRRRVEAAQRRALRRAVAMAGGLMAVFLVLDLAVNLLIGTSGIADLAPFTLVARQRQALAVA